MVSPVIRGPVELSGRKLLIVDDERLNIRNLSYILKAEDYVLAEADSGERALEIHPMFQPDLILLDVMLPISR